MIQILIPPLTAFVIVGKLFNLTASVFSSFKRKIIIIVVVIRMMMKTPLISKGWCEDYVSGKCLVSVKIVQLVHSSIMYQAIF